MRAQILEWGLFGLEWFVDKNRTVEKGIDITGVGKTSRLDQLQRWRSCRLDWWRAFSKALFLSQYWIKFCYFFPRQFTLSIPLSQPPPPFMKVFSLIVRHPVLISSFLIPTQHRRRVERRSSLWRTWLHPKMARVIRGEWVKWED